MWIRTLFPIAVLALAPSCTTGPPEPTGAGSANPVVSQQQELVPGYTHSLAKSWFNPGPGAHDAVRGNVDKTVGDYGVFAVDRVTGVARAIPNAGAPCLSLPSYGSSPAEHNSEARRYLVSAGVPAEQLTFAQANAIVTGGGPTDDPASDQISSHAYVTTFQRMLKGIEVIDSIAWVRLDSVG